MSGRSGRWQLWLALASLSLWLGVGAAGAQGWSVAGSAGQTLHHAIAGGNETLNATLGLRYDGPRWLYFFGGYPLDEGGTGWIASGLGARVLSPGAVRLGLDAAGDVYGYRHGASDARGVGATIAAMPLLSFQPGPGRVEVRSGLMHYVSSLAGESWSRSVHRSDARLTVPLAPLRLSAEARHVRAEEGAYPFLGAAAELQLGDARVWGSAGRWIDDRIDESAWSLGGAVEVAPLTYVSASYRRDANDPLYWNGARTNWNFTVGRRLGVRARPDPLVPVPVIRGQEVTFRIPVAAAAEAPHLAGDFTRWQTVPMRLEGPFWSVTLSVSPGLHRYAFRRPDGEWFVPESLPGRADDGFGGVSAVVYVPDA